MSNPTEQFQILSARDHVRLRPGMYVGSTSLESLDRFVLGKWKTVSYVPALLKMVDEIIDNCIDEAIRTQFKFANEIAVNVQPDRVTVRDNGRGIPLDEILDTETGERMLRPVAAWTKVRAGSSFDAERVTIGANGVGSSCVNFMSQVFIGRTCRDGRQIEVRCSNGAETVAVIESASKDRGTTVEFRPDFTLLGIDSIDQFDHIALIQDRITSLQIAFPEIKFKINGRLAPATNLRQYSDLYSGEVSSVTNQTANVSLIITSSVDGFRQTGFVNGVNTRLGGSYNDYVINGITDEMQAMIKRKHKVEVTRSTIKGGLTFVLFARNFTNPQYDSQTKERLTSSQAAVREHYEASGALDFKQLARKVMACDDIVEPIVAAQVAKKLQAEKRDALQEQKKLKRVKVQKHVAASGSNATLFLAEGDSAMGFLLKVRDPVTVGGFPLRGVIMNVYEKKPIEILKNKELADLIAVLGLDINDPNSVDNMYYQRVATLTDADHDGIGHIMPLLLAFFYRFWPRLFSEERIAITRTPILISTNGKDTKWFYTYDTANNFKQSAASKGYTHRYIKGLASHTEEEYSKIINQPVLDTVVIDDPRWFDIVFSDDSGPRKEWIKNNGVVASLLS